MRARAARHPFEGESGCGYKLRLLTLCRSGARLWAPSWRRISGARRAPPWFGEVLDQGPLHDGLDLCLQLVISGLRSGPFLGGHGWLAMSHELASSTSLTKKNASPEPNAS